MGDEGICSFDLPSDQEFTEMQNAVCPYKASICGDNRVVTPGLGGAEETITIVGNDNEEDYVFGQVCSYEVSWPADTSQTDGQILLTADRIDDTANVYVAVGDSIANAREEQRLTEGGVESVSVRYPDRIFVVTRSADDLSEAGFSLRVKYQIAEVVEEEEEEPETPVEPEPETEETEPVPETEEETTEEPVDSNEAEE